MARKQALAKVEPETLTHTEERWSLIQRTFAKDATPDEFSMFRAVAEREGLDPFTRQIHFVKRRTGDVSFVVGVHGLVARLNRVPGFRGIQSAAVCQGDRCVVDAMAGTVSHQFDAAKRGAVVGAWARGQIGDRLPVVRYVSMDEYRGQSPLWREKPATMLEKVAIVQCARALAPEELGGLNAAEEFGGQTDANGGVTMPKAQQAQADEDALTIQLALSVIETVPDIEGLEAALAGIREEAKGWAPTARKLFKSHVERRRVELTPKAEPSGDAEPPEDAPLMVWEDK